MIYALVILGIFLLDYYVKKYMDSHHPQGSNDEYAGGRLILRNCHNPSGMLGIFKGREKMGEQFAGAVLLCGTWEMLRTIISGGGKLCKLGLAFILGGGCSNYYDRMTKGYVTDYVSFGVKNKKIRGIVFNISDFFIMFGTILYMLGAAISALRKK